MGSAIPTHRGSLSPFAVDFIGFPKNRKPAGAQGAPAFPEFPAFGAFWKKSKTRMVAGAQNAPATSLRKNAIVETIGA